MIWSQWHILTSINMSQCRILTSINKNQWHILDSINMSLRLKISKHTIYTRWCSLCIIAWTLITISTTITSTRPTKHLLLHKEVVVDRSPHPLSGTIMTFPAIR